MCFYLALAHLLAVLVLSHGAVAVTSNYYLLCLYAALAHVGVLSVQFVMALAMHDISHAIAN
jgi:predicted alpha/beta-hydrolase family hydrolase